VNRTGYSHGPGPTLADTAGNLGAWRWLDQRLFEVAGGWVPTVPEPAAKVWLAEVARHHAWRAEQWADRFPVLRELDLVAATAAPPDWSAAVETLVGPPEPADTVEKLAGLVRVVLPRLLVAHERVLRRLSPVADGALLRTMRMVVADELDDWRSGEAVLQPLVRDAGAARRAADAQARVEVALLAGVQAPASEPTAT
jgi:hypothetical protein